MLFCFWKYVDLNIIQLDIIFDIPIEGPQIDYNAFGKICNGIDRYEFLGPICMTIPDSTKKFLKTHLRPDMWMINKFITNNNCPRGGSLNEVTFKQEYVLYVIAMQQMICLPFIMLKETYAAYPAKRVLPFAAMWSWIWETYKVPMGGIFCDKSKGPIDQRS